MPNIRSIKTMQKKSFALGNMALMDDTDFWQGKPKREPADEVSGH